MAIELYKDGPAAKGMAPVYNFCSSRLFVREFRNGQKKIYIYVLIWSEGSVFSIGKNRLDRTLIQMKN
ncbi:hypothetical protein HRG84_01240 [Flavisolibacter sp. BT320]|nr:hypothetical protein [Flavisolibacter longurius]